MLANILSEGLKQNASDIILSPGSKPSIKLLWEVVMLDDFEVLSKEVLNKMALDIMSASGKERFLKNKELDFSIAYWEARFRVNAFVEKKGYGLVFRVIPNQIPDFDTLWFPWIIKEFSKKWSGLVLVTGSVWSGKSTTMAALVEEINKNYQKHIITVEDPIEFSFENKKSLIEQREVGSTTLTFENGLKYALRQAPDVIMVWEMRDLESFRLALRAAETGNLVFATLHTAWAARTIARIIDMFPSWEKDQIKAQISGSLIWVIWQKLLKTSDWKGRVPAVEVMINTTSVWNIIRKWDNHQLDWVIETSSSDWMISMKKSLEDLRGKDLITQEKFEEEILSLWK